MDADFCRNFRFEKQMQDVEYTAHNDGAENAKRRMNTQLFYSNRTQFGFPYFLLLSLFCPTLLILLKPTAKMCHIFMSLTIYLGCIVEHFVFLKKRHH